MTLAVEQASCDHLVFDCNKTWWDLTIPKGGKHLELPDSDLEPQLLTPIGSIFGTGVAVESGVVESDLLPKQAKNVDV